MSHGPTIDYDALAKKSGATGVDYDSLAQQHGGRTEQSTDVNSEPPSAVARFITNIVGDPRKDVQGIKDRGIIGYLKDESKNAIQSLNPLPAMQSTYQSAVQGWNTPRPDESTAQMIDRKVGSAGRWLESGIPWLGPALARSSEQFDSGDTAGGLGSSVQLGLGASLGDPNVRAGIVDTARSAPAFLRHPVDNTSAAIGRGMDRFALGDEPPARTMTRALKPSVAYPNFEEQINTRLPEMAARSRGNPITSVSDIAKLADELQAEKNTQYQNLIGPFREPTATINGRTVPAIGPYRPAPIDATPVADAQVASIPTLDLFEKPNTQVAIQRGGHHVYEGDPGILQRTMDKAAPFRREVPIGQLDAIRVDSNAKLNDFYNKAGGDQYAALSNPETARMKAINDTTRDLVYDRLEQETGVNPRPTQDAFGDYTDIGNVAGKRNTVFSRQQPIPLQESINSADALARGNPLKFAMAKAFKRYGNSDNLAKIAMDRFSRQQAAQPRSAPINSGFTPRFIGTIAASMRKRDEEQ